MKNMYQHNPEGTTTIFVTRQGQLIEALISTADYDMVNAFPNEWGVQWDAHSRTYYVRGEIKRKKFFLHRWITDAPKGTVVDHLNHNGLDNRRENLNVCGYAENRKNIRDLTKPVEVPSGLIKFVLHPQKNGDMVYWGNANVNGVYLGRYEDYAEALLVQYIGNAVMDDATDEELLNRIIPLGHKAEDVQKTIDFVRKTLNKKNPSDNVPSTMKTTE